MIRRKSETKEHKTDIRKEASLRQTEPRPSFDIEEREDEAKRIDDQRS